MGHATLVDGFLDGPFLCQIIESWIDGPHERPVAAAAAVALLSGVLGSGEPDILREHRIIVALILPSQESGVADAGAARSADVFRPIVGPLDEPRPNRGNGASGSRHDPLGHSHGHGGIVGGFAGAEAQLAATDHFGDEPVLIRDLLGSHELQGAAQRILDRHPVKGSGNFVSQRLSVDGHGGAPFSRRAGTNNRVPVIG